MVHSLTIIFWIMSGAAWCLVGVTDKGWRWPHICYLTICVLAICLEIAKGLLTVR